MDEKLRQAELQRQQFIDECLGYDIPRIEAETYPEEARLESDIFYKEGLTLDIYSPDKDDKKDEIFLLIHGGAFVYGNKENDKCFGMHLAVCSGISVANINYRLMPDTDLKGQLEDIFAAIAFLHNKGIKVFHTVGDSAGGYLALSTAILINSLEACAVAGIKSVPDIKAASAGLICSMYKTPDDGFPGIYFENYSSMPSFIYDLSEAVKAYGAPSSVIVTGEEDFLRKDNNELGEMLSLQGIKVKFYDAASSGERHMYHVYPISCPTWPEGKHVIKLISDNANGK